MLEVAEDLTWVNCDLVKYILVTRPTRILIWILANQFLHVAMDESRLNHLLLSINIACIHYIISRAPEVLSEHDVLSKLPFAPSIFSSN